MKYKYAFTIASLLNALQSALSLSRDVKETAYLAETFDLDESICALDKTVDVLRIKANKLALKNMASDSNNAIDLFFTETILDIDENSLHYPTLVSEAAKICNSLVEQLAEYKNYDDYYAEDLHYLTMLTAGIRPDRKIKPTGFLEDYEDEINKINNLIDKYLTFECLHMADRKKILTAICNISNDIIVDIFERFDRRA